jgi:hypothetical protein
VIKSFLQSLAVLVALATMGLLTGCAGLTPVAPPARIVLVAPDDAALVSCDAVPPPDKEAFVQATDKVRVEMLRKTLGLNYGAIEKCNVRWAELRAWKVQQKAIHDKPK